LICDDYFNGQQTSKIAFLMLSSVWIPLIVPIKLVFAVCIAIGNKDIYKCTDDRCKISLGRDYNGARNILLRNINNI
jgi:hypothetical protein